MVTLRDNKVLKESTTVAGEPAKSPPPASDTKKRKAQDAHDNINEIKKTKVQDSSPREEEKENMSPPSTPKGPKVSAVSNVETKHEKTPGRLGPVKREHFSLSPDIKPFKGPPGKKVRKTAYEKNQEYIQFIRENEGHCFHELHVCFDKGPNGSPTLDKSGFELDYAKVAEWVKPTTYNKGRIVGGMERAIEKRRQEEERMAEIFFEKGEAPERDPFSSDRPMHWKDRVSKDLNVPWHKIGVEHFEEWEKKGFKKARKGEYENFSEAERKRMTNMLSGASLRK